MKTRLFSLIRYELANLLRSRWLPAYALFFFFFTAAVLQFGGDTSKAIASLLSIVLFIVPSVSILYASIYWYNSESYRQLLLTQPIERKTVYLATTVAISLGLALCFALSAGAALLLFRGADPRFTALLVFGTALTGIFVGIGLLIAVVVDDRMKGIGFALLAWLYFAVLHDALVFSLLSVFSDYPVEIPSMVMMALNPVDLTRVSVLLMLDTTAMMGYTGKVLQQFLSGPLGLTATVSSLALWAGLPLMIGLRRFKAKDL